MTWKVAHACVRGSSHVRSGLPNQDAAQCIVSQEQGGPPTVVVAVSDGHGGARHFRSQIGSSLAVSTAVSVLQTFLGELPGADAAESLTTAQVEDLQHTLVETWSASVMTDLVHQPLTEDELSHLAEEGAEVRASVEQSPILAYGATLLVAAATEKLLLFLQLGDGEILSVTPGGETTRPLPHDERLVANQTTSLCQPEAWKEFRAAWVDASAMPALVLVSTDGYSNSFRSDEDFLKIGQDYLGILREQGIAALAEELPAILTEATQQGSGDDITLAILQCDLRRAGGEADRAPVRPPISPQARSAIISQLKARHSSQRTRLDELSSRLEESRKTTRRLQVLMILLALIVIGVGVYLFRGRLFGTDFAHDPDVKPKGTIATGSPGDKPPYDSPAPKKPAQNAIQRWKLAVANADSLTLKKGMDIKRGQIVPDGDDNLYARVAQQGGKMLLINDSDDVWKVKPGAGEKPYSVKKGAHVVLGKGPDEIEFTKKVSGTVTEIEEPVKEPTQPDQPPSELNL
jgi:serine/threonine protein phosphatase PrpC